MKTKYLAHLKERKTQNLPPLPLNAKQTKAVVDNLTSGKDVDFYLGLLTHRTPAE